MADTNETFNRNLYDLLRTKGFNPVPKDSSNNRTDPETADVFKFTFKKDGTEYGDAWVTLDDDGQVTLYSSNELEDSPDARTQGVDYDDTWTGFQKHLRYWALTNQPRHAKGYQKFNRDRLGDDMARREYMKKKERLEEGYYPMGKQASYSDTIPTVKIILQHTRQIQEGEQRYRNVSKIFLENTLGERILAPTIRPGIAQVYARHIAEGGVPNDERWNHIKSLCEEYGKMAGFVRATKNHQFNESAQELVNTGVDHYVKLRETLGKMRGHRGYTTYFESWTPTLMEDNGDDNTINELFVQETMDPRIESVLPILSKLRKNVSEMKEVDELAEWADSLTEAPGDETLANNEKTEDDRLKALDLAEDDDAVKRGKVARDKIKKPAFMRRAAGEEPVTLGDVERSQQHRSSQAMVGQKGQEVEEGWNDRLDDPDNYEEYLDRLRDLADYNRKRDIEDPPQQHTAPTDDSKKKADESVDDMFSLSGKLPRTDRIDNVSGQDLSFDDKMRASTIKSLLQNNPNLKIEELPTNTADLISMLDQYSKKNVSEMDNRTPAGDRREQRAYSPEKLKQREKELQADLKKVSPEMRKKLRLPEPKEGVAEGLDPIKKKRLNALIDLYREANDPNEYANDQAVYKDDVIARIRLEFGDKIADRVEKSATEGVAEGSLNEFAPGDDSSDGEEDTLFKFAKMWYNGNDGIQQQVEAILAKSGWEIGELESEEGGAFVVQSGDENGDSYIGFTASDLKGVAEDLDANQKRVGQLGPTESVKNNNIGKLVGASESIEAKLKAITEMDKSQPSSDRGGESSGDPYAKGGKAKPVKANDAAKDAEKVLNKAMDNAHKKDGKEGQEDLDAILRIIRK